jgi:hypothetical protein
VLVGVAGVPEVFVTAAKQFGGEDAGFKGVGRTLMDAALVRDTDLSSHHAAAILSVRSYCNDDASASTTTGDLLISSHLSSSRSASRHAGGHANIGRR